MSDRAFVLDVTRLVNTLGSGALTGVDRVELAYLREVAARGGEFLVKTSLGFLLLPNAAAELLESWIIGTAPLPEPRFPETLRRKVKPKHRALGGLRRMAKARALPVAPALRLMLRRAYPQGGDCWLVGQGNWSDRILGGIRGALTTHVMVHDTIPLDVPQYCRPDSVPQFRARFASLLRHADHIIANSQDSARAVARHAGALGQPVPPVTVALLGLEPPAALAPATIGPPAFVALGTIEPRKNHALLLDVWERLPRPKPLLAIIGQRGWMNEEVFARLDRKPEGVQEISDASDADVRDWLSKASALLMPSHAEGFGLPVAEAAALGVPVVAHDLAVYREFLGNYPVYVDNSDAYSWEKTIRELASLPVERKAPPALPTWDAHFERVFGPRSMPRP